MTGSVVTELTSVSAEAPRGSRRSRRPPANPGSANADPSAVVPLPPQLVARLEEDLAGLVGIVAPVGVGTNAAGLRAFAKARGLAVHDAMPPAHRRGWIWFPKRRSDLLQLARDAAGLCVLADGDTDLDLGHWSAALVGQAAVEAATTWKACGGWPAAFALARARPGDADLHRHPEAVLHLAACLPPHELRGAFAKLATATFATAGLAAGLGVEREAWHALQDGGWLWHAPGGWSIPTVLRKLVQPEPDPGLARLAARALVDEGHEAEALATLAGAAVWSEYLALLARRARAGQGEAALRAALAPLPPRWRDEPSARYVAGLLARAAGDPASATALYTRALAAGLEPALAALAHNARGVVEAMRGEADAALADFDAATAEGGVTAGEAGVNRATMLVQLGRHAEAETSLEQAVAAFRSVGDAAREARSLGTLGGLHFGRGLVRASLQPYEKALALLLPSRPRDAARTHLNLAESALWLGDDASVAKHLAAARSLGAMAGLESLDGWVRRLEALLALRAGDPAGADALLAGVRTEEPSLLAECALLRARCLRLQDRPEAAAQALAAATGLGLRHDFERALLVRDGLDAVIDAARREEARLELVEALIARAGEADLAEALELIRTHGWRGLLDDPSTRPLAALAADADTRALFPIAIHVFGPLRVRFAGRTLGLVDFPTRKSAALLVALAMAGRPQPREALAERFWGGSKNPLGSLQTAIYHLRAALGVSALHSDRGIVSLLLPATVDAGLLADAARTKDSGARDRVLAALAHPVRVLPDLPSELDEERGLAERLLGEALDAAWRCLPEPDPRRRDALRAAIATDPFDSAARDALVAWHEARGEAAAAETERRALRASEEELERSLVAEIALCPALPRPRPAPEPSDLGRSATSA